MEKQINEKIIEMDREYPFLFCFKSDFWMEQQMIRQNIFEDTYKKTNAKNDVCLRSEVAFRLPFFLENTDE